MWNPALVVNGWASFWGTMWVEWQGVGVDLDVGWGCREVAAEGSWRKYAGGLGGVPRAG